MQRKIGAFKGEKANDLLDVKMQQARYKQGILRLKCKKQFTTNVFRDGNATTKG